MSNRKKPCEMTQDELLERAAECERLATRLQAQGDAYAARAYILQASGWLEEAIARV